MEHLDLFYKQLQNVLDSTPRHDLRLVIGDFNAKVGNTLDGAKAL